MDNFQAVKNRRTLKKSNRKYKPVKDYDKSVFPS